MKLRKLENKDADRMLEWMHDDNAEFAITICRDAMGMGYSKFGMHEIIRYGFEELDLANIYWCVSPENKRAIKFYDKNGYPRHKIDAKFSGVLHPGTDSEIYLASGFKRENVKKLNMKIYFPLLRVYKAA